MMHPCDEDHPRSRGNNALNNRRIRSRSGSPPLAREQQQKDPIKAGCFFTSHTHFIHFFQELQRVKDFLPSYDYIIDTSTSHLQVPCVELSD